MTFEAKWMDQRILFDSEDEFNQYINTLEEKHEEYEVMSVNRKMARGRVYARILRRRIDEEGKC